MVQSGFNDIDGNARCPRVGTSVWGATIRDSLFIRFGCCCLSSSGTGFALALSNPVTGLILMIGDIKVTMAFFQIILEADLQRRLLPHANLTGKATSIF